MICDFLQYLFDNNFQYSTITGYVSAISAGHSSYSVSSLGLCKEVSQFLRGVFRLRPPSKSLIPSWDPQLVLKALSMAPFEPLEEIPLKYLTWKTVFLVAVTSASRVSELQALDVRPQLLKVFESRVVLHLNPAFLPKVLHKDYVGHGTVLEAFKPAVSLDFDFDCKCVCPVRAVKHYIHRTKDLRKDHNLFISYAINHTGYKVSSQTISRWIRDTICLAYEQQGVVLPSSHVSAHSTRAVAASLANLAGVSPSELCAAAMWSNYSVFARFYRLDMVPARSLSSKILGEALSL